MGLMAVCPLDVLAGSPTGCHAKTYKYYWGGGWFQARHHKPKGCSHVCERGQCAPGKRENARKRRGAAGQGCRAAMRARVATFARRW